VIIADGGGPPRSPSQGRGDTQIQFCGVVLCFGSRLALRLDFFPLVCSTNHSQYVFGCGGGPARPSTCGPLRLQASTVRSMPCTGRSSSPSSSHRQTLKTLSRAFSFPQDAPIVGRLRCAPRGSPDPSCGRVSASALRPPVLTCLAGRLLCGAGLRREELISVQPVKEPELAIFVS